MTILNRQDLEGITEPLRRIYSTNWDLCFKQWVDYVNIPMYDWTDVDKQSSHVLSLSSQNRPEVGFIYTPLHGSLDLVKLSRLKGEASYEEIAKIPDPIRYFEGKPDNIKDIFMIYPLEAVGYEESIKSPYLDLLNEFRSSLRRDNAIFIIGYSLRDPIIGSIFEEVIAERIRKGDFSPLSKDIEARMSQTPEQQLKIFVINPEPLELAENLRKQFNNNLLQTFIPLKLEFPKIDERFDENFKKTLFDLIVGLVTHRYLTTDAARRLVGIIYSRYGIGLSEDFPWKTSFAR